MNWKLAPNKVFADQGNDTLTFISLSSINSKIKREIKIEVNNEVIIPTINVVAKPKIGPEPKKNNTTPTKNVVICESKIEDIACLYPSAIACLIFLPKRSSSRILS